MDFRHKSHLFCRLAILSLALLPACTSRRLASTSPQLVRPAPTGLSAEECRPCHEEIYESYIQTAHYKASALPSRKTILGHFDADKDRLRTRKPTTYFKMEAKEGSFFQTAYWADVNHTEFYSRKEEIGVVMGAGIDGQSYLYWQNDFLYQLPVSYLVEVDDWVTSPGFEDGEVFFGRPVLPRCLECHGTYFELEGTVRKPRYSQNYQLGITCWKCHGDGAGHIARYQSEGPVESGDILNPADFLPARQIDLCSLCHGGVGERTRPPFTYRPGEDLSTYIRPPTRPTGAVATEPGGWLASTLLLQSRCFKESGNLTCLNCHNVHEPEQSLPVISRRCLQCHKTEACGLKETVGDQIETLCVDCHMPDQPSGRARVHRGGMMLATYYRNHHIGVYGETSSAVLDRLGIP